jgi:hypothetical protein
MRRQSHCLRKVIEIAVDIVGANHLECKFKIYRVYKKESAILGECVP